MKKFDAAVGLKQQEILEYRVTTLYSTNVVVSASIIDLCNYWEWNMATHKHENVKDKILDFKN